MALLTLIAPIYWRSIPGARPMAQLASFGDDDNAGANRLTRLFTILRLRI